MIVLNNVTKQYHSANAVVTALDSISLEIAQGEFVAIRGPSGCGKSTLLAIVGTLASPTSGTVTLDNQDIVKLPAAMKAKFRAEKIGFVFQMFHLLPYLNVRDNVLAAALPGQHETAQQAASELLERFQLNHRLTHLPSQLSAGERQRVAMARAMLNKPAVILADEPTGNLDPVNAQLVLELLADFCKQGGTVMLVTHDDRTGNYCHRTIEMTEGRLVTTGDVATG